MNNCLNEEFKKELQSKLKELMEGDVSYKNFQRKKYEITRFVDKALDELNHYTFKDIHGYQPQCKFNYTDCVYDDAYIEYHHPEWHKERVTEGRTECPGCEDGDCYDDEDK